MSKAEVVKALGTPESTAAADGSETLTYILDRAWFRFTKFRVKLANGKVESYE